MFFLGASANIFTYLLVSGFFLVCLISGGDKQKLQLSAIPGYATEHTDSWGESPVSVCICTPVRKDQKEKKQAHALSVPVCYPKSPPVLPYPATIHRTHGLRAPPQRG